MKGRKPTVREKEWLDRSCDAGCCVCMRQHNKKSPAMPHHREGKTKEGAHFLSIPLCYHHHNAGIENGLCVSFHKNKKEFEARYGTEQELWDWCREQLG